MFSIRGETTEMPDPADYGTDGYGIYDYEWDDEDDETSWDAASACLGMVGIYLFLSLCVILVCVLILQLAGLS